MQLVPYVCCRPYRNSPTDQEDQTVHSRTCFVCFAIATVSPAPHCTKQDPLQASCSKKGASCAFRKFAVEVYSQPYHVEFTPHNVGLQDADRFQMQVVRVFCFVVRVAI